MAVGPIRTVLVAHLQSTKNRMVREMGRTGATSSIVVLSILFLLAIIPLGFGLTFVGYALMETFNDPSSRTILIALFTLFPVFGGMTSGLVAGARELAWERYRGYPIRTHSLFTAELVAAFGDIIPIFVGISSFAMALGIGISEPRTFFVTPLLAIEAIFTVLIVQMLVGGLAEAFVKRLRNTLGVVIALALIAFIAFSTRTQGGHLVENEALTDYGRNGMRFMARLLEWLPTGAAMRSLSHAQAGAYGHAFLAHLYPVVTLLALGAFAAWLMAREAAGAQVVKNAKGKKLWSFRSQWMGVARAHFESLVKSPLGRFGWLMPLFSLVLVKGPLAHALGTVRWNTLSSFSYVAISTIQLHFGAFGMDGHGIKSLLLLPISPRTLLVGKLSAVALYHFTQLLLLTALLVMMGDASLVDLVAGFLLATAIFFTQAAMGHRVSVWMPRAFPKRGMRRTAMPLPLTLLSMGTFSVSAVLYGAAYVLGATEGPLVLLAFMLTSASIAFAIYLAMLKGLPAFFERHREKLLGAVGE